MVFNFNKCKCLHLGQKNANLAYKMSHVETGTIKTEKDLGVSFSSNFKVSEQCEIAALKVNRIFSLMKRNIGYKENVYCLII